MYCHNAYQVKRAVRYEKSYGTRWMGKALPSEGASDTWAVHFHEPCKNFSVSTLPFPWPFVPLNSSSFVHDWKRSMLFIFAGHIQDHPFKFSARTAFMPSAVSRLYANKWRIQPMFCLSHCITIFWVKERKLIFRLILQIKEMGCSIIMKYRLLIK